MPFNPDVHPPKNSYIGGDGQRVCTDIFDTVIKAGETVDTVGKRVERPYYSPSLSATDISVEIYKSSLENPQYTNEETATKVAVLKLELDINGRKERALIDVTMIFGGTFIQVEAQERDKDNVVSYRLYVVVMSLWLYSQHRFC